VAGYRQTVWCREGEGDPVIVSLGVASDPTARAAVAAGAVFTGKLVPRSGHPPEDPAFLLVAETPVPPLAAEAPPTPDSIPNNHMAYAIQWFFFAATLTVIYIVYLRRGRRAA
jgi:surfeit locus 1 family protein